MSDAEPVIDVQLAWPAGNEGKPASSAVGARAAAGPAADEGGSHRARHRAPSGSGDARRRSPDAASGEDSGRSARLGALTDAVAALADRVDAMAAAALAFQGVVLDRLAQQADRVDRAAEVVAALDAGLAAQAADLRAFRSAVERLEGGGRHPDGAPASAPDEPPAARLRARAEAAAATSRAMRPATSRATSRTRAGATTAKAAKASPRTSRLRPDR